MPLIGDIWESYRSDEFVLIVDGVPSPSVSKVTGLKLFEFDTVEQPDGATSHVYKVSGTKGKFDSLTIERNVDGSDEDRRFREWFDATFRVNSARPGGSSVRKSGTIEKRHNGEVVLTFAFYAAWVKSVSFTDLEAGSNNLLKQTIVLEHEGLELVG